MLERTIGDQCQGEQGMVELCQTVAKGAPRKVQGVMKCGITHNTGSSHAPRRPIEAYQDACEIDSFTFPWIISSILPRARLRSGGALFVVDALD